MKYKRNIMQWQWIYRTILIIQAGSFIYLFWWGPRGWRDISPLQTKVATVQEQVDAQKEVVAQLETEERSWHTDSFNKERIAREELQMARAGDVVFYR